MILTDGIHLVSDSSLKELHQFAKKIGLQRAWFQEHDKHPHYDLTTARKLRSALEKGATRVSSREIIEALSDADF